MSSSTQLGDIMETSCEHCQSRFRLSEEELRQAYGKVRCGECGAVFNALLTLKSYEGDLPDDYFERQSEESRRLQDNAAQGKDVSEGELVTIKKKDRGIFN